MQSADQLPASSCIRELPFTGPATVALLFCGWRSEGLLLKRIGFLLIGMIALTASGAGMTAPMPLSFAEPYSGKKVNNYQVTLPVARSEKRLFMIPEACEAAMSSFASGASQWGTRVEQRMWWKVRGDCQYYGFLYRFPKMPSEDYVSSYDFMNAYLRDIPMGARCAALENPASIPGCEPFPPGVPDLSRLLPFVDRGMETPRIDVSPCQMQNGIFRGRVIQDKDGIHCEADLSAPGFRVISVNYADVNGDGYLDVVLRLIPLGRHAGRMPLILPLTRKDPNGVFTVPTGTVLPEVPGNQ